MARALGRADKEQLCIPGQHWEPKGLGWWHASTPGWAAEAAWAAPIFFCQYILTLSQRVARTP